MSYTLIERKELTSSASSISFENIPQFYSDLILQVSSRTDGGGPDCLIRPNGSTSNMSGRRLRGNGSNVLSSSEGGYLENSISTDTASTFSNGTAYFPNYSGSTFKSFSTDAVRENNATDSRQAMMANLWSDTAPITSLTLVPNTSVNFVAGSSFSLYGINRQQAIGSPKAVGGAISFANGYWVHTFTGSGTFSPKETLDCEYLVVAGGGGGGGSDRGGGGGAGGYRSSVIGESSGGGASAEARLSLAAGSGYIVSVGAGGAGGTENLAGTNGISSVFSTITSVGGGGGGNVRAVPNSGNTGGSGGGGSFPLSGSGTSSGGSGTTNQGFRGGNGRTDATTYANAGGGGGASAQGVDVGGKSTAGNGGAGLASSVTGTSIIRAAGGGGGADGDNATTSTNGIGGIGGWKTTQAPTAGAVNTGSGGGGATYTGLFGNTGSAGGAGIVIIRYKA